MKNFTATFNHGSLTMPILIRGESKKDVEKYIKNNMDEFEALRISNHTIALISVEPRRRA